MAGRKKPDHEFTDAPDLAGLLTPLPPVPLWDPTFAPESFDELIRNRGLRWLHYKAAYCPNVKNLEIQTHDPNCRDCENGYLMIAANRGEPIFGTFQQNKLERLYEINGLWDTGQAIVTFTAYNLDGVTNLPRTGEDNDFKVGDKLVCIDYLVSWSERIEHSPKGVDRLKYPAVQIDYVADRDKRYMPDTDFIRTPEGYIQWLTPNQPKVDMIQGRGGIFTIIYRYHPVFYVEQLVHELRATKGMELGSEALTAVRLPQQVLIKRDYMFADKNDNVGQNTTRAPANGTLVTPE